MDSIDDITEDFIDILTKISFPRIIKELTILLMSQRFWKHLDFRAIIRKTIELYSAL